MITNQELAAIKGRWQTTSGLWGETNAGVKVAVCDDVTKLVAEIRRLWVALGKIADYDHAKGCTAKIAPIYECSCDGNAGGLSQWEIAEQALEWVKRAGS